MYNSRNAAVNLAKTWKIVVVIIGAAFFSQYLSAKSQAQVTGNNEIPIIEQPVYITTPEQLRENEIKNAYNKADFLTIVDTDNKVEATKSDFNCLAENIYYESGHEPLLGKFAVAQVTLNRAKNPKFSGKICNVITAPYQFSWVTDTVMRSKKPHGAAWDESLDVAHQVLDGRRIKGMEDVLYFHAAFVNPKWPHVELIARIGQQVFYRSIPA